MTKFQSIKYNEMNTFQDRVCRQIKEDIFFLKKNKCQSVAWEYVSTPHIGKVSEHCLCVCITIVCNIRLEGDYNGLKLSVGLKCERK